MASRALTTPVELGSGEQMHALMSDLYPICRSITGEGVRRTLRILQDHIPVEIREIPSGTPLFDWTAPREWNIRGAWIKGPGGEKIVDFNDNNLHVMSYSVPLRRRMPLAELRPHLFTDDEHPDWIPYRTSYYKPDWGFCITRNQLESLEEGEYEVVIDSSLQAGSLTLGECLVPGETDREIFISTHVCHPSMCNDNLSGVVIAAFLARSWTVRPRRHSLRVVFVPGCIGAIAWLATNEEAASRIRHGMVVTCAGDAGPFTYKRSRRGNAAIDRAAAHVLKNSGQVHTVVDFSPYGYDERQYCSPGFDLPVGCFMRTPHGQFPEYHSSADNLDFVRPENLEDSLKTSLEILDVADRDRCWLNLNPKCEPQLGRRGLYRTTGGSEPGAADLARLWVLNFSDGSHSLLDIAERSQLPFSYVGAAADELALAGLLQPKDSL